MGRWRKSLTILGLLVLVALAVILEEWLRARSGHEIQIMGLPLENIEATGSWKPDFLWIGKAWWIDIESDRPVELALDDWTGEIPPGSHKIYSDGDSTNTGEFGSEKFWGFPDSVEIRIGTD